MVTYVVGISPKINTLITTSYHDQCVHETYVEAGASEQLVDPGAIWFLADSVLLFLDSIVC